jgi:hypothetical protein
MGWDGTGWDGMGCDGIGSDRIGSGGIGWDGIGWDQIGIGIVPIPTAVQDAASLTIIDATKDMDLSMSLIRDIAESARARSTTRLDVP